MDCPKCGSGNYVKAGKALGRQRYKCKKCGRHYTVKQRSGRVSAGEKLPPLVSPVKPAVIEIDEMHTYIHSKKNSVGFGLLLTGWEEGSSGLLLGDRSAETGGKIWRNMKTCHVKQVMTDYWQPYCKFVPPVRHIQSKAETYTVEGYNGLFRHFLARLRRKTKYYSKSKAMRERSLFCVSVSWA